MAEASIIDRFKHRIDLLKFKVAVAPDEKQLVESLDQTVNEFKNYVQKEKQILEQINSDTPVDNFEDNLGQVQVFLMQTVHEDLDDIDRYAEYVERKVNRVNGEPEYHQSTANSSKQIAQELRNEATRFANVINSAVQRLDHNEQPEQVASELEEFEDEEVLQKIDANLQTSNQLRTVLVENRQIWWADILERLKKLNPRSKKSSNDFDDFSF